jgi:hypothetical protein
LAVTTAACLLRRRYNIDVNRKITRKNRIAASLRSSAWQKPAGLFAFDLAAVGSGGFCRGRFFRPSGELAGNLHWYKPWDKVLDDSNPPFYRWFTAA